MSEWVMEQPAYVISIGLIWTNFKLIQKCFEKEKCTKITQKFCYI